VALATHPHLEPTLKDMAIPLLPLSAFMGCYRVKFTLLEMISIIVRI
jgi:hypothetical protein